MIGYMQFTRVPRARHSVKDLSRHPARRVGCVLFAVVLFFSSFVALAYHDLQNQVTRIDVRTLVGTGRPTRADNTPIPDDYAGVAVNILILGTDSRAGDNNIDGSGEGDHYVARSDTAMIMHVSADRSRIEVVSIPRDTLLPIPSCTRVDGETTEAQSIAEFNSAFAAGAGDGADGDSLAAGAACTIKTVEELTNLRIDEYMVVDFTGLQRMVDALGGVTLYVDEEIDDTEYTGLVLAAGCQHLDGTTALGYARARHGVGDGSDLSRITRQQNLMAAMIRTAMRKNLLTNADDLYSFARSALSTLTTSPGIGSLTTLAGLAQSIQAIGINNIHFVTMPNAQAPSDINRVVPAPESENVWAALINDQPISSDVVAIQGDGSTAAPVDSSVEGSEDGEAANSGMSDSPEGGDGAAQAPASPALSPAQQCEAQN